MDCLRSGRDGTEAAPGVEDALAGLTDAAAGGPPKKSRPKRESPGFVCLGGGGAAAGFGGGGRALGVSVVLGRAGGVGTSPNKSMFWGGFGRD